MYTPVLIDIAARRLAAGVDLQLQSVGARPSRICLPLCSFLQLFPLRDLRILLFINSCDLLRIQAHRQRSGEGLQGSSALTYGS